MEKVITGISFFFFFFLLLHFSDTRRQRITPVRLFRGAARWADSCEKIECNCFSGKRRKNGLCVIGALVRRWRVSHLWATSAAVGGDGCLSLVKLQTKWKRTCKWKLCEAIRPPPLSGQVILFGLKQHQHMKNILHLPLLNSRQLSSVLSKILPWWMIQSERSPPGWLVVRVQFYSGM